MADKFQLKALITGVDQLSPALAGIRKNIAGFRKALKADGLGDLSFRDVISGGALAAPVIAATKAAIDFESAMADVKKVVDFDTPAQFKAMGQDIQDLSKRLPMAAKDIAAIVAAGGQAGIGRNELGKFAEDAVKMGVAFDQTAAQAGEMMATWRTAFKMGQDQVVALADQINLLGNTGPAKASKISEIVTRIGPLGEVAGFAASQIAAMGATLAGMGVQEEIAATGIKNMMLTLTSGASATKEQQETFKALRLDAKKLAVDMQRDAQGTVTRVLTAVSKVDKSKQASVLEGLFGRESIGAIAPLLTNMDLLEGNFKKVGDAARHAGSMQKEYESRAATTANGIVLLQNRVTALGISVGTILLPPLNQFLGFVGPLVDRMADFANANPAVIKGVLGAAAGLLVLKIAVIAVSAALRILTAVTALSPLGIAVRAIAVAAGFLLANWESVGPFFSNLWASIVGYAQPAWEWIKKALSFTPLGLIVSNWEPIVAWFQRMWERIKPYVEPLMNGASWVAGKVGAFFGGGGDRPAPAAAGGVGPRPVIQRDWSVSLPQQTTQTQQLRGEMLMRFENAPPGLRVDPASTNQPGLSVTPKVGYRSLAGAG
ncbi:phage tail tape measure protein [Cupriavidus oxalaticus]|uniref:Phage tail tape measure protein n=1 Tax=Cupriavidus oxalaticus TaxID=96344 RepID=A0A4P7LK07_9BURK|nr:phage tail tape measure protein [Cupriavidus oxalaticus]QBY56155.1 phage tail tape measure protein [Cupriavidus oxalaticus]